MEYLLIALGGAVGALGRFGVYEFSTKTLPFNFPYATLIVNVIGSMVMGFFIVYLTSSIHIAQSLRSLILVGFCGAFTTFSTFSMDNFELLQQHQYWLFALNICLNVVLCLLALLIGIYIASKI